MIWYQLFVLVVCQGIGAVATAAFFPTHYSYYGLSGYLFLSSVIGLAIFAILMTLYTKGSEEIEKEKRIDATIQQLQDAKRKRTK